ncbi:MAG TPA: hypothetical protein PKC21_09650 [Oligoflexia bacterium]|nr:hypothetical protein [Oligoflexia bacterium]HMR25602.1 hypothetical protein [Oligoflexia bacterium]
MNKLMHSGAIVFAVLATTSAYFVSGQTAARSVICGAGLMYLNFLLLFKIGKMIFMAKKSGEQVKGGFLLLLKLLGLFAGAYICLTYMNLDALWFALAATGMILTITLFTAKEHTGRREDSNESLTV